ncbi:MAG: amidohydrolase family protein [Gammaproteobacteria bacterium]|nr:amidohydrolase family protein [Gammaproteobacteria bacterium]
MPTRFKLLLLTTIVLAGHAVSAIAEELPLIDAHIHYSHDAWEVLSPEAAVELLRRAGIKKALVSSSSDEGTQKLYRSAPDLVVPVLRPYRKRGELSSWIHDDSVKGMLSDRLEAHRYAGIGEFHADGEQIELPVPQHLLALAQQYNLFLHAHVDMDALQRIFRAHPDALVLWAHAGFESPETIAAAMDRYPNLWADLSFREEFAFQGTIEDRWRSLFEAFPARFLLGTDTYTPERWFYVSEYADWVRGWLTQLPPLLAENIAYRNAEALLTRVGN